MTSAPSNSQSPQPQPITDSPWLWLAAFCAAGLLCLSILWPQYAARQRRLEMQYLAQQEIIRREKAGEAPQRPAGQEGERRPPAPGELLIPLWPLAVVFAMLLVVACYFLRKSRRHPPHPPRSAP